MSDPFIDVDAVGQAELVRRGEVSAAELVEAAIDRIERLNPELNAVIMTRYDEARAEAAGDLPDGPLRGVPFLLKDIGATQAGTPNHFANRALKAAGHMSEGDTVLGARFRDAGLVTLGKTNLPELGTVPVTQSKAYGPARNPWDPERSPATVELCNGLPDGQRRWRLHPAPRRLERSRRAQDHPGSAADTDVGKPPGVRARRVAHRS